MTRVKTALILLFSVSMTSPLALAADIGTYRPGNPYAAVQATNHNACESQCNGDAACRGWNFVKANPRQTHGICEFNALAVDPIQSPIGISANQTTIVNYTGNSQIIPTGVRTTRIGRPTAPQAIQQPASTRRVQTTPRPSQSRPKAQQKPATPRPATQTPSIAEQLSPLSKRQNAAQQNPGTRPSAQSLSIAEQLSPLSKQSKRQVVREAIPEQKIAKPVAYRHNLETQGQQASRPKGQTIIRTQNGLPPRAPQYQNEQYTSGQQHADPRLIQQFNRSQTATATPPVKTSENNRAQSQRGGLIKALTQGSQNNPSQPAQRPQFTRGLSTQPASLEVATQRSLYGHLNDDVAVPKPLSAEDLNTPNDQPIPTVSSVPVKPVDQEEFPHLAGR